MFCLPQSVTPPLGIKRPADCTPDRGWEAVGVSKGSAYPVRTMAELSDQEKKSLQEALLALLEELSAMLASSEEGAAPVDLEAPIGRLSRMDALQNQAMALESERRRAVEIQRIDAALQRIEDGEFGYCAVCGDNIEPKRLSHDPKVPNCIACTRACE